jgi:hypothetical protein
VHATQWCHEASEIKIVLNIVCKAPHNTVHPLLQCHLFYESVQGSSQPAPSALCHPEVQVCELGDVVVWLPAEVCRWCCIGTRNRSEKPAASGLAGKPWSQRSYWTHRGQTSDLPKEAETKGRFNFLHIALLHLSFFPNKQNFAKVSCARCARTRSFAAKNQIHSYDLVGSKIGLMWGRDGMQGLWQRCCGAELPAWIRS